MDTLQSLVGGEFVSAPGPAVSSHNPARAGAEVARVTYSDQLVDDAALAASKAWPSWSSISMQQRWEYLVRFRTALGAMQEDLATAIVLETGKLRSEARTEVQSLLGRFDLVRAQVLSDFPQGPLVDFPLESLSYRPHGVVAVIGPFNFPLHLCHAHVVPALLMGNAVIVKPSEVALLCGYRYALAAKQAGFPEGVFNVLLGGPSIGAKLVEEQQVKGLAFTGSWNVGRKILERTLERPGVLVALEMGGKNAVVVTEGADLRQAVNETIIGGFLTTGQRCTCTDRVLVHRSKEKEFTQKLVAAAARLKFGDPEDPTSFAGPLSTEASFHKVNTAAQKAVAGGALVLLEAKQNEGGYFRSASIHRLPETNVITGYTDIEVFGPDLSIEVFDSDEEAIERLNQSPYGFAISVFTGDDAAFERYKLGLNVGILNRNRSTNQASPRLPFGGVGLSGNHRPAGAWAARNMVYPVASQSSALGVLQHHAQLTPFLGLSDFEALSQLHEREEATALESALPAVANRSNVPTAAMLSESRAWLERLYAGDRIVRDKKLLVVDHERSSGAYLASVDGCYSVLDAMSQTATMPVGFRDAALTRDYIEGGFGDFDNANSRTDAEAGRYRDFLSEALPGYRTISFTNCGAEANEKAYALCLNEYWRKHARGGVAPKLLAFNGSFHGRTLLSLYGSHNPSKREPFEIKGYEATFGRLPMALHTATHEVLGEAALIAALKLGATELRNLATKYAPLGSLDFESPQSGEHLLASECQVLADLHEILLARNHFAVAIEPMQSEGGDRYVSGRFHRALRILTRDFDTPLIMDEVQAGFGLGGTFAWHSRFNLVSRDGSVDRPDCVIFAKRAQVGVVFSTFDDPEPTAVFGASLHRGLVHLTEWQRVEGGAAAVEQLVQAKLIGFEQRWPELVAHPRVDGYAFSFDLPSASHLNRYLGQRFWRGVVVFAAGDRTARYRLNQSFGEREVETLFESIHQSLAWLIANPGKPAPVWDEVLVGAGARDDSKRLSNVNIRVAHQSEVPRWVPLIMALEKEIYEEARRDSEEKIAAAFNSPDALAIIAEKEGELLGYALGGPLELFAEVDGPKQDPLLGAHNVFYASALSVHPNMARQGLGLALKTFQVEQVKQISRDTGQPRYMWMTGRNRVGAADAMHLLTQNLGAIVWATYGGQYGEDAEARYYRLPLQRPSLAPVAKTSLNANLGAVTHPSERPLNFSEGTGHPMLSSPDSLTKLKHAGKLFGPSIHKVTLCNYVTPEVVRAVEWIGALEPRLPHVFLTSGRDELVDKAIRMLRFHRPAGKAVITVNGAYVGHTTASARSVSDPKVHSQGPEYFSFPRVSHPVEVGAALFIKAIEAEVEALGGADACLGIMVEPIQERTGRTLSNEDFLALFEYRKRSKIPLVFCETTSAFFRTGLPFYSSAQNDVADIVFWWTGGQLGVLHVATHLFVRTPLTFVSTWDGDELSLIQAHHRLRQAQRQASDVGTFLSDLEQTGFRVVSGQGLCQTIELPWSQSESHKRLSSVGLEGRCVAEVSDGVSHYQVVLPIDMREDFLSRLKLLAVG